MRIAVLADLHANLPALRAVLDDATALECDTAWCVGDVVGRGPHPTEVVAELRRLEIPTVQGNWDEAVGMGREHPAVTWPGEAAEAEGLVSLAWTSASLGEDERAWLRQLPMSLRLTVHDRSVLLFHGSPVRRSEHLWASRPSRAFARIASDEGDDLFCFGHTHEAFHLEVGKSHFVAAGTVGGWKPQDPRARYAVLDIEGLDTVVNFRAVPYDTEAVERDMLAAGLAPSLLAVPPAEHAPREGDLEAVEA
jgi:putative phosphoesterase